MIENGNAYAKYGPVGVCGYLQDEYGKLLNNNSWPALAGITVPGGNTSPAQGTYDNDNPPRDDGKKLYKFGGNHLHYECP